MFQQGHLTRRQDPLWGERRAHPVRKRRYLPCDELCATGSIIQHGRYARRLPGDAGRTKRGRNQRRRKRKKEKHPGGELHWRALEDYVMTHARAKREKVSVFTGPIFNDVEDFDWDRGREGT